MRIRNNKDFNIKIMAQHGAVGAAGAGAIVIPAGAQLELTDAEWKDFAKPAESLIESGNLELTKAPALSEEEVEANRVAALEAAQKLIDANKPADKPVDKPAAKPAAK